ncbi:MAG: VCBS repeat-containing protein [Longimicrobiales bacterium]
MRVGLRLLEPLLFIVFLLFVQGCGREDASPIFTLLPPERTGVTFANTITTTESHNIHSDIFIYNGAGVAVGDVDNDGLADVYLTGNMVSSRLYLNRGDMRFEDVTGPAGVATDRWATGATMVDIEGDGDLDIYVSVSGPESTPAAERANLLFVNDGAGRFTEAAAAYGIADTGFTTHAVFLDYDRDGDLDLFLLGNSPGEFARGDSGRRQFGPRTANPDGLDRLYRNNGDGTFTNVSEEAGLSKSLGYGLGVVAADVNRDGWPDIYVSNDITPNDVLYINNKDGTFTDRASEWLGHTSYAGMGIDIADFNNDAWPDILQTDMMPADLTSRKRVSGSTTYADFFMLRRTGFSPSYNLNTLQLNQGIADDGSVIFSEIARLAGVAYTDWSWSALFADFDNDGLKDILITNGYPKAVTDYDYQSRMINAGYTRSEQLRREILDQLDAFTVPNAIFRNNGDLTFTRKTEEWGLQQLAFSYGAAYADLNNDGRLDLVINNIDAPAFIFENVRPDRDASHYLQVRLEGDRPNRQGIGANLVLTAGGKKQYIDHSPYRGYLSTMDGRVHFGLGSAVRVDSLEVTWPDGRYQVVTNVPAGRMVTVHQSDATYRGTPRQLQAPRTAAAAQGGLAAAQESLRPAGGHGEAGHPAITRGPGRGRVFRTLPPARTLSYTHQQNNYPVDYGVQPLLPHQLSRHGPPLAVADVTGDGLDDVFIGGAAGLPGTLFVQQADGGFIESTHGQPWAADSDHEDWGAVFFDANGDALADLYVTSGGYHHAPTSRLLQDRLYINQGDGRFTRAADALPEMLTSTASVSAGDFTGDGRPDLFVGGRVTPRNYPYPTRSYLLRNDGGRFTDVTAAVAPELIEPGGMITEAVWTDFTGDGQLDLVTVGTWMPVQFYANDDGRLRDVTEATRLPPMRGWWYSLAAGDVDNDGDVDLFAGNLGLNHSYTTSADSRFGIYAADFTGNRSTEIILTQEIEGTEYPFYGLALLGKEIDILGTLFPTFESFADASVEQIFGDVLSGALHYQVDTFATLWLRNNGDATFTSLELPAMAQVAPIRSIIVHDTDGDGNLDVIVAGNLYDTEPNTPRADAGKGLWLRGDGRGGFTPVAPSESGLHAPFDARGLAAINTPAGPAVLVANNGGPLQVFAMTRGPCEICDPE